MGPEYVALDLETTGLDPERDRIIEIGAVRFSRDGVIGTFHTLVNPRRPVPRAVQQLTGITEAELAQAPGLELVAADLEEFIRGRVLVGHNIYGFDAPLLEAQGIRHSGELYDTQFIASVVLPSLGNYGLSDLAAYFGIAFPVQHRAGGDAEAARVVFLRLLDRALELPAEALGQIAQWLTPTQLPWRGFFREAWEAAAARKPARGPLIKPCAGNDLRPLKPRHDRVAVPATEALAVLGLASRRRDLFPAFDERAEQRQMLEAVANALNGESRLMVEAGTGTGKSLAYLIPAACHAAANGTRVVVSTSTINLQEQLTRKDLPAVEELLGGGVVRSCQLKGRRNYLCLRRFNALRAATPLSDDEAMLAAKVLVWLGETETGDRGELRLTPGEEAAWHRISGDGAECSSNNSPYVVDGTCFVQRARKTAEASHIVVVNHALLLSDIATGGRVVPPYENLVIDEAHHLEDEATRQFGFTVRQRELMGLAERGEAVMSVLQASLRAAPLVREAAHEISGLAAAVREAARAAKPHLRTFCDAALRFLHQHAEPDEEQKLLISRAMRVQPDWEAVEIAWDNARLGLGELTTRLERMAEELREAEQLGMLNYDLLSAEVSNALSDAASYANGVAAAVEQDDRQRIVWLELDRSDGGVVLSWAPLDVSGLLAEGLYKDRKCVVLTGATLRTQGGFRYLQERLGLAGCETLALGSPFDYRRAALVLVPRDIPEPDSPQFLDSLAQALIDLVRAAGGRALVLFTSHSLLRAAHAIAAPALQGDGITALAQGVDGSPRQLVKALKGDPRTVIFGTSSFWEGVDVPGDALSLLVITRLPFQVPTDPVFAARSELYEDSFNDYALPQAVIRFKQGFGRLIRSRTDRGVFVVLDRRIVAKRYGTAFLEALPQGCPLRQVALRDLPGSVAAFLAGNATGG